MNPTVKWQVGDIIVSSTHVIVMVSGTVLSSGSVALLAARIGEMACVIITWRYGNGDRGVQALDDKLEVV